MDYTTKSCREFVTVLASSEPAPGGGGAAALVGAIGTALGNMVGSLTVGKKKYADVEAEIIALQKIRGHSADAAQGKRNASPDQEAAEAAFPYHISDFGNFDFFGMERGIQIGSVT